MIVSSFYIEKLFCLLLYVYFFFVVSVFFFFFFKQKTPYEMRISDWSSDVCSSDLSGPGGKGYARSAGGHPHPPCHRSVAQRSPPRGRARLHHLRITALGLARQ